MKFNLPSDERSSLTAFTLLEVMIAMALFFVAMFSILELTSRTLSAARGLQRTLVDPGIVAAHYCMTNQLEEGSEQGDFGDEYPDATWMSEIMLYGTNGMYQVHIATVQAGGGQPIVSELDLLVYKPASVTGSGRGRLNLRNK